MLGRSWRTRGGREGGKEGGKYLETADDAGHHAQDPVLAAAPGGRCVRKGI